MSNEKPEKLTAMSRLMARVCGAILFLVPLAYGLVWLNILAVDNVLGIDTARQLIAAPETSAAKRLGGFVLSMIPQLALLYGVWHLKLMFDGFAAGVMFGETSANHLRSFARGLFGFAVLDFIIELPLSAYIVWEQPFGTREATLSLYWHDFQILFLSLLFFALTLVMAEGIRLARENDEFV